MLSLLAAAAVALAPITVGIHDDNPVRALATCEAVTAYYGPDTQCALLPAQPGPTVDVVLYLDDAYDHGLTASVLGEHLKHLEIPDGRIATDLAVNAPAESWGGNAGTTYQPYDETEN